MMQKRLINIGPCSNRKDPSKTGGIVVLFEDWQQYCREKKLKPSLSIRIKPTTQMSVLLILLLFGNLLEKLGGVML